MTIAMIRSLQSETIFCFAPFWSWKAAAKVAKVIEKLLSARLKGTS
jgi:hypothetical protein